MSSENMTGKVSVIKFGANWCGPCKKIKPFIHELEDKYPSVEFLYYDTDKDEEETDKYNIAVLPTFVFLFNDEEEGRVEGINKKDIEDMLINVINNNQ